MKTVSKLLVVVLILQGLILAGQWANGGGGTPAYAQIPDAGSQRLQIIEELKSLNAKIEKLNGLLDSGKLQVRVVTPDEKK